MDYEKAYKEALERAKAFELPEYKNIMVSIFPELKESEDERIRKALVRFHKSTIDIDGIKGADILAWLEKQDEQKPILDFKASNWYVSKVDGKIHDMTYNPADKVEPRFKVKYAGSEYNVLEVKDIAGVTFYGIEDEPNHIDYIKAENCEIISGYAIKENGSPYPTKPAVFSEQKPFDYENVNIQQKDFAPKQEWSDEDEKILHTIIADFKGFKHDNTSTLESHFNECINWLKSLKDRIGG